MILVGDPTRDDDAPAPATAAELCDSINQLGTVRDSLVDGTHDATIADLREAAQATEDVGRRTTSLDERSEAGLEFFVGLFLQLPDEPTEEQLLSAGSPSSVTDRAHTDALETWLTGHCT